MNSDMKRRAYMKPEARALMIQPSGHICTSMTNASGEGLIYDGPGGDNTPQANSGIWQDWDEEFSEDDDYTTDG